MTSWLSSSFSLLLNTFPLHECAYNLFIHSPMKRHLACFNFCDSLLHYKTIHHSHIIFCPSDYHRIELSENLQQIFSLYSSFLFSLLFGGIEGLKNLQVNNHLTLRDLQIVLLKLCLRQHLYQNHQGCPVKIQIPGPNSKSAELEFLGMEPCFLFLYKAPQMVSILA